MLQGICLLEAPKPCQVCQSWSPKIRRKLKKSLLDPRAKSTNREIRQWTSAISSTDTWLGQLASLTSSDLVSETSSIKDSELLKLDIEGNSYKNVVLDENLIVGTMRAVEVSVHQEPSGVTSSITEQAPTQHTMVATAQCTTALTYAPMLF